MGKKGKDEIVKEEEAEAEEEEEKRESEGKEEKRSDPGFKTKSKRGEAGGLRWIWLDTANAGSFSFLASVSYYLLVMLSGW